MYQRDFITPIEDVFVKSHVAIPEIDPSQWSLTVTGSVENRLDLDLAAIRALPARRLTAFHECFGNPFTPDVPSRDVANVEWTGVPLGVLLDEAVPGSSARHVWFEGSDRGPFQGGEIVTFLKDLPLEVAHRDVLLAYEVNGEPLPTRHGFPLRVVAPRLFGTNSVKWLARVVVADVRPEHLFTTQLYNRVPEGGGPAQPVREVDVNSKLFAPGDAQELSGGDVEVRGKAWSFSEVVTVEVAVDDGPWEPADLVARGPEPTWQAFSTTVPLDGGPHRIRCRATDRDGRVQPLAPARNAVHEIAVRVADLHQVASGSGFPEDRRYRAGCGQSA